jgi:transposase
VEAVLYRYRAGIPGRDLPERFGDWKIVHQRFGRWTNSGVFERQMAFSARQKILDPGPLIVA